MGHNLQRNTHYINYFCIDIKIYMEIKILTFMGFLGGVFCCCFFVWGGGLCMYCLFVFFCFFCFLLFFVCLFVVVFALLCGVFLGGRSVAFVFAFIFLLLLLFSFCFVCDSVFAGGRGVVVFYFCCFLLFVCCCLLFWCFCLCLEYKK